jgi:hypothetical protein
MDKTLIERLVRRARRLARRLLPSGRRLVSDTLLYALVIYGVGCIVPTPLDPQVPQADLPPVFVTTQIQPPFGPITHQAADVFDFQILADDPSDNNPNSQDDLWVRLFWPGATPGSLMWTGYEIQLTSSMPGSTQRQGAFMPLQYCSYAPNRTGENYLYAILSNRRFNQTGATTDGKTDTNYWVLTCGG